MPARVSLGSECFKIVPIFLLKRNTQYVDPPDPPFHWIQQYLHCFSRIYEICTYGNLWQIHSRQSSKIYGRNAWGVFRGCRKSHQVGGLEHLLFSHILGIIIPIDFHIFQRGGPTTNQTPGETLQRKNAQRTVHVGKGRRRKANPSR